MLNTSRRLVGVYAVAALLAVAVPASAIAATRSYAYFAIGDGSSTAYLIDWLPKGRASVVAQIGAQAGTVSDDGTQKTITFDTPLSFSFDNFDECGLAIQQRHEVRQLVVRTLAAGTTQFVEMGAVVNVGGCQDGRAEPFGAPTDEGRSLKRMAMSARPAVADLVPGTEIAGFSEEATQPPGFASLTEDVVTLQSGSAQFHRSGTVVPAAFDANKWLVFSFPGFQRAYTRLVVDAKTGGETWLLADWAGGQPQRVEERLLVKAAAGAGFGTVAETSRMWESGLFINTQRPFFFYFYKNGTGERVQKDLDLGTEVRLPVTWGFDGLNLVQLRVSGPFQYRRTWEPLRNQGKFRWVMESETLTPDGDEPLVQIKPRVNYYEDTGKAVPPAQASQAKGMDYLNSKPQLAR